MPKDQNEWTQGDAVALRTYLSANPKFLAHLSDQRPEIRGSTMEERAMTGSDAKGFFDALDVIKSMTQDPIPSAEGAGFIDHDRKEDE